MNRRDLFKKAFGVAAAMAWPGLVLDDIIRDAKARSADPPIVIKTKDVYVWEFGDDPPESSAVYAAFDRWLEKNPGMVFELIGYEKTRDWERATYLHTFTATARLM